MASNTGHVMNLSNSVIGVSLLAMPFCFKQCGISLAIIMLLLSSIISRLACYFLVKSSTMCRRRNFEFLAFYTFGPSGKLLVELGVIGFMMGTCVAFFVVMGDLGPAIISKIFNINNNGTLRTSVLIGLGFLVVLPLGLLRNVESLAAISTVTIGYYFLFVIKIFFESSPHLVSGDWWSYVRFWHPEGILQCIPIFAMALSCQTQLFEIYNSLPSPSIGKMNAVVRSALNLCTGVYASVGLLGYIAYCKGNFTGNIMLSFSPSLSSELFKLGFVMSIAVSFPLVIFPCRASLFSLIFKRMPIHQDLSQTSSSIPDSRFKCLTIAIILVALITGLLIPSIELVLGFVGSTIGIAICVIFPSLSFLNLCNKNTNERVMAKVTLCVGLAIMTMGTFGNLFAAVEQKPPPMPVVKLGEEKNFPQIKIPLKIDSSTETPKKSLLNKNNVIVIQKPADKFIQVKPPEILKPDIKIKEGIRKEPPIPVAPMPSKNENEVKPAKPKPKDETKTKVSETKTLDLDEKKTQPDLSKGKQGENINKDAIEKENREIKEVEEQKKTEEEQKQQELLKRLKEHQDEQKKLLLEQEKILKEIKNREKEKEKEKLSFSEEKAKTIKPEEFKESIKKIENVLESLKQGKNATAKRKESIVSVDVLQPAAGNFQKEKNPSEVKSHIASVPLPLVKLRSQSGPGDGKNELIKHREISESNGTKGAKLREKREANEEGECENTKEDPNVIRSDDSKANVSLIKNSVHLSVGLPNQNEPEIHSETLVNQNSKKDLKSIS